SSWSTRTPGRAGHRSSACPTCERTPRGGWSPSPPGRRLSVPPHAASAKTSSRGLEPGGGGATAAPRLGGSVGDGNRGGDGIAVAGGVGALDRDGVDPVGAATGALGA